MQSKSPNKDNLSAVVVLYQPDSDQISVMLNTAQQKYKKVYVIDNSPHASVDFNIIENRGLWYQHYPENIGLGKAYNMALKEAQKDGSEWLLVLDQDSELDFAMIEKIFQQSCALDLKDVALLSLRPHENPEKAPLLKDDCQYKTVVISSGSIVNIAKGIEVGGFEEKFFIDGVDCEFCFRVALNGYKSLRFNNLFIKHTIGLQKKVNFLGRKIIAYNHAPIRRYYMVRNNLEMWLQYRGCKNKDVKLLMWYSIYGWVFRQMFLTLWEKQRLKKFYYSFKGALHFCCRRFGKL